MADATEFARAFIHLAQMEEPEADVLTPLRLQKLLYFLQGWSLALRNRPAFEDEIEAWAHGPVVRKVYGKFKVYGSGGIPPDKVRKPKLDDEDMAFTQAVWDAYKGFSAIRLRQITHLHEPWRNARGDRKPTEKSDDVIERSDIKAYFKKMATKKR